MFLSRLRYDNAVKTPPTDPEFERFTDAMRKIVKVSKVEMQRRIEAQKRTRRAITLRAARASGARPKRAV